MLKRIKRWLHRKPKPSTRPESYTRQQVLSLMEQARSIGYNDGRRDGLAVAREQATKSLKEILWAQNQNKTK